MEQAIDFSLQLALLIMVVLLMLATYRIWVGPSAADRLQAVDATTTILIGIIILLALVQKDVLLIDVGIALAAFGFVATLATARFIAEGKVF